MIPDFYPEEWEDLISEDLCAVRAPGEVSGETVYCQLVFGHGGRHYNRFLKWFWSGGERDGRDGVGTAAAD